MAALTTAFVGLMPCGLLAQDVLAPLGGEYVISGSLPGNQVYSDVAFDTSGGYVVWQDDAIDGVGSGIAAQRLNNNLSGSLSPIRINSIGQGHQEKPRLALMRDGGAAVVWHGGEVGKQDIYLRLLRADGTFVASDLRVNQYSEHFQVNAAVAVLTNGNIVVVWESSEQDGHLRAVMGRMFAADGTSLGSEFQVNQQTHLNQRSPAVAALADGGFVVVWVSEVLLGADQFGGAQFSAQIIERKFDAEGGAMGSERRLNVGNEICANPSVSASGAGGYVVAWSQNNVRDRNSGWDVYATGVSQVGEVAGDQRLVNENRYGDQFEPRLARHGGSVFVVWTSLGQDGSFSGVYGRILNSSGVAFDRELKINTTTYNRQLHPVIAADSAGRFLAVWSSFLTGGNGFELFGQRLASTHPLPTMPAPFASPLSQSRVLVTWPSLAGYAVDAYELHVDGAATPITTTNSQLIVSNLLAGSSHSFRLTFLLSDGRRGDLSTATLCATWGEDGNFDGLPDDWQRIYWPNLVTFPDRNEDSDGDGASNLAEFLAGTNPTRAASVLAASIEKLGANVWLKWNSRPGSIYRIQYSADSPSWNDLGGPRFAPDTTDAITVGGIGDSAIFRILRMR